MEDNHIRLTQMGRLNKKDENGVFSAGFSYINPRNILYLEEARLEEEWKYTKLINAYKKDPNLDRICWWIIDHYIGPWGSRDHTDTQAKLFDWWTKEQEEIDNKEKTGYILDYEKVIARHTRVNLVTGKTILVEECPEEVKKLINAFFEREEENKKDRIVVTKDDIVKNFIFKNLS